MAVRKRESKLFDRIKKNIKNVHFTRIESSTVNGIPDVHGTGSYQALLQSSLKLYRVTCVPNDFSKQDPVLTLPDPVPVARWHELRALLLHH
jgi:hypothetical protein